MVILIIGGSGSGKSAFAEKKAEQIAGTAHPDFARTSHKEYEAGKKYYLAAMEVRDEEMRRKVERHRRLRAGKGWHTLEYPVDAGAAADFLLEGTGEGGQESRPHAGTVILLEDLGNLTANEMFRNGRSRSAGETAGKIDADLKKLENAADTLIIVSNAVFGDGILYDAGTQEYIRALGTLHRRIAARAAEVTEVVAGIPVKAGTGTDRMETADRGENREEMEIIVGGQAQGKLETARREHPDYTIAEGEVTEFPSELWPGAGRFRIVLNHTELLVRRMLERGYRQEKILEEFAVLEENTSGLVLIFDEIGEGIVPMDPFERRWREITGRVMTELAAKAGRVERIVCGIPQILK